MKRRTIKSANDSYQVSPGKPLVSSQSAKERLSTYAVAPVAVVAVAPVAVAKKDTHELTDEYTDYFPEDKTEIPPGLDEVLDLDNKTDSTIALNKYKKENGITYGGKKSKTKKSKTKKRKIRLTKRQNKNKNKRRSRKRI
jgi:hypothetical protein